GITPWLQQRNGEIARFFLLFSSLVALTSFSSLFLLAIAWTAAGLLPRGLSRFSYLVRGIDIVTMALGCLIIESGQRAPLGASLLVVSGFMRAGVFPSHFVQHDLLRDDRFFDFLSAATAHVGFWLISDAVSMSSELYRDSILTVVVGLG